jgi:hypothetical protein
VSVTPLVRAPKGIAEVREVYGDIRAYIRPDGTLRPEWERHQLGVAELPGRLPLSWDPDVTVSRIRCHRLLVGVFEAVFAALLKAGLWVEVREYGGCFAYRAKRGADTISLHAWGAAIDLNPRTNQLGEEGDMHPEVVRVFESRGFTWGGRWGRPDPMHFQYASGY